MAGRRRRRPGPAGCARAQAPARAWGAQVRIHAVRQGGRLTSLGLPAAAAPVIRRAILMGAPEKIGPPTPVATRRKGNHGAAGPGARLSPAGGSPADGTHERTAA